MQDLPAGYVSNPYFNEFLLSLASWMGQNIFPIFISAGGFLWGFCQRNLRNRTEQAQAVSEKAKLEIKEQKIDLTADWLEAFHRGLAKSYRTQSLPEFKRSGELGSYTSSVAILKEQTKEADSSIRDYVNMAAEFLAVCWSREKKSENLGAMLTNLNFLVIVALKKLGSKISADEEEILRTLPVSTSFGWFGLRR